MQREADLAGAAGRVACRAILDGRREKPQGMRIHLGAHKAFVAGKAAATDLDWNSDMFRAGLRNRRQLGVETHPPRRARQVQRDRSREALRYFDIGEHVVMQELAEIE